MPLKVVFGVLAPTGFGGPSSASSQLMEPADKQEGNGDITLGNGPRLHTQAASDLCFYGFEGLKVCEA